MSTTTEYAIFPAQIAVQPDPKELRSIHVDADQQIFTTDTTIVDAFKEIDAEYSEDREAKVTQMHSSVSRLAIQGSYSKKAKFDIAHLTNDRDRSSDELMLVMSPLNDGKPTSSVKRLMRYIGADKPSFKEVSDAKPNSWSPLTKLSIGHDFIAAAGNPMPTAQVLSPVAPRSMTFADRWNLVRGDYTAYGKLAQQTINYVNEQRRIEGKNPVTKVHLFGAGIGQRALGAARYLEQEYAKENSDIKVVSAHAMNLSLKRGTKTATDHVLQRKIASYTPTIVPKVPVRIPEPKMRQEIDRRSDSLRIIGRQLNAFRHIFATIVPVMFAYKPTLKDIDYLIESGINVRISNARNVAMGSNTLKLLAKRDGQFAYTDIAPVADEQAGMMTNEHAALVAVMMSLGPRDATERTAR